MANKIKDSLIPSFDTYVKHGGQVDKKTYLAVVRKFMSFAGGYLLVKGDMKLPERLGEIQILGRKSKFRIEDGLIKGLAPDWKATKELWAENPIAKEEKRVLFHFNEETNGIRYKFFWSKHGVIISNKTLYQLRLSRKIKRKLAEMIKLGHEYLIKD